MPYEEKSTWVGLIATVLTAGVYAVVVLGQLGTTPAADIAFQRPLIIAVVASIIITVVGVIVVSVATAVGVAARGEDTSREIDVSDERDRTIGRHGELVGFYVASVGIVATLAITMLEWEYVWIASLLYLSMAVGSAVGSIVKIVSYHRGF